MIIVVIQGVVSAVVVASVLWYWFWFSVEVKRVPPTGRLVQLRQYRVLHREVTFELLGLTTITYVCKWMLFTTSVWLPH